MKFIGFNGSPSGENSATSKIMRAFLEGAHRGGAQTKLFQLGEFSIEQCKGCFSCWFQTPGRCIISDEMNQLLQEYQSANIICFGSPVYSWNMTALLKNFVDRLIPLKNPLIVQSQDNFDMADTVARTQTYVAISNCGFPGENNFDIIKTAFSCCNPSLEIYRNCGRLLNTKNPQVQEVVSEYLGHVETAGYEMSTTQMVSDKTKLGLSMPLMTTEEYVKFLGMA